MQSKEQQLKGARDRLLAAIRLLEGEAEHQDLRVILRTIVTEIDSLLRAGAGRS